MNKLKEILGHKPTLLIGNGINLHDNEGFPNWNDLLVKITEDLGLNLDSKITEDMSNTERYDIIDLAYRTMYMYKPSRYESSLQQAICSSLEDWDHTCHHKTIVNWAMGNDVPIITVNFDKNLSYAADIQENFFTDRRITTYPWNSYYSKEKIKEPESEFAIWHAHGTIELPRSIRLGLRHYMNSVINAKSRMLNNSKNGLFCPDQHLPYNSKWSGLKSWLQAFLFNKILVIGFGFEKDETFLRWLFLERAFFRKKYLGKSGISAWIVDVKKEKKKRSFFESLNTKVVNFEQYSDIYENDAWE